MTNKRYQGTYPSSHFQFVPKYIIFYVVQTIIQFVAVPNATLTTFACRFYEAPEMPCLGKRLLWKTWTFFATQQPSIEMRTLGVSLNIPQIFRIVLYAHGPALRELSLQSLWPLLGEQTCERMVHAETFSQTITMRPAGCWQFLTSTT